MNIWAIADLHLSFAQPKPMSIFGAHWQDHYRRIAQHWWLKVHPQDVVLIAGDISWAMKPVEAEPDLNWIGNLPGRKIMIKGNHDFWWGSARKVRQQLPADMFILDGEAMEIENTIVCGTRGWLAPNDPTFDPEIDQKPFERQLRRLERALDQAQVLQTQNQPIYVMLHYPPLTTHGEHTPFLELILSTPVHTVLYGHLHDTESQQQARKGWVGGVRYQLIAADYLQFDPQLLSPSGEMHL
ncbi:MAG: hypothetical protein D6675_02865 [Gemmatimonadetes bacterium]|nr:MAG: hypothetical protein D6675_02865 [Gemmatimonadota bacterium]